MWAKIPEGTGSGIRCTVCAHHCVLREGQYGICGVRRNTGAAIINTLYGQVAALAVDPVEKKPLYHVYPGTTTFSVALPGCNFHCEFCQNHRLAQISPHGRPATRYLAPHDFAKEWKDSGCPSVSFTYSEPTVWIDWMLDCARLVRAQGGKVFMVTNGYFSPQTRELLLPLVDACNIDLKGTDSFYRRLCGGTYQPVLDNIRALIDAGCFTEVTTLLIEGEHSLDTVAELGHDLAAAGLAVWHLSRFFPACRMMDHPPTSKAFLLAALDRARTCGIPWVYGGNMALSQDTLCRGCKSLLIERTASGRGSLRGIRHTGAQSFCCAACGQGLPLLA